jgi:ornithine cyclodeaminase
MPIVYWMPLRPGGFLRIRPYADTLEGVRAEGGDFIKAGIDWTRVRPLAEAIEDPRPHKRPVVFKSVGHALFDLAAARLAVNQGGMEAVR